LVCQPSINNKLYTAQNVQIVFFALLICFFGLTGFSPTLKKISLGIESTKRIIEFIKRKPKITAKADGIIPDSETFARQI